MNHPTPCNLMTDYVADQHTDQGLFTYTVIREDRDGFWDFFICEAEDGDHAEEQSENADPSCPVLWVNRGLNFSQEEVYDVTIEATVRKTYRIHAGSEEEAVQEAHDIFDVTNEGPYEDYDEQMVNVREVVWD